MRRLMAADLGDTPSQSEIDLTSGFAYLSGALDYEGDVDVFKMDVNDFDSFSTLALETSEDASLNFRVLDAAGNELANSATDSGGWVTKIGGADGVYYLEVSSLRNEITGYVLHVSAWTTEEPTFPEVTPREDDANEIGVDATVIDIGSGYAFVDGTIEGKSDQDVFTFEVLKDGSVVIAGTPYRVNTAGFKLTLYDAEGNLCELPESSSDTMIETKLSAGKYFVVASDSGEESVDYGFRIATDNFLYKGGDVEFALCDFLPGEGYDGELLPGVSSDQDGEIKDVAGRDLLVEYVDLPPVDIDMPSEDIVLPGPGKDVDTEIALGTDDTRMTEDNSNLLGIRVLVTCLPVESVEMPPVDGDMSFEEIPLLGAGVDLTDDAPIQLTMHNSGQAYDVNGDSHVSAMDALIVINWLNNYGSKQVREYAPVAHQQNAGGESNKLVDINNDGYVNAMDILMVINQLNSQTTQRASMIAENAIDKSNKDESFDLFYLGFSSGDDDEEPKLVVCPGIE
jgi:hypothetical protein